jgi:hypothetical protein
VVNQRRRGRPPGLVSDATPANSLELDADIRAGWLMRSWRLHLSPDSNARSFAGRLTALGHSADASRVSRWETGRLPVPLHVVSAYEQALDLPRGILVALTMVTRRLAHPRGDLRQVLDPRHVAPSRFQEALDLVVDGDPCGGDWLDVASFAASHPGKTILPTSLWQQLVRRLVQEHVISVGAAYATRNQAAQLLGLHPTARRALVLSVGEHVADNRSLVVADAISLLKQVEDPGAADLAIRLLTHPDEATRNGAISAVVGKLARGQLDRARLAALEATLIEVVRLRGIDSGGLFARIGDVVALMPAEARWRVHRAAPVSVPRHRPSPPPAPLPRSLVAQSVRAIARPGDEPEEPMIERLVEEALTHRISERRFQASLSIALSPYCARVARGAAMQLREHAEADPALGERMMVLLTLVATQEQRGHMRALAEDPSSAMRVGALLATAHLPLPGAPSERADLWALTSAGEADEATLRASIYCAGMTGDPILAAVEADDRQPQWVRASAGWWRQHGPGIHESPPLF